MTKHKAQPVLALLQVLSEAKELLANPELASKQLQQLVDQEAIIASKLAELGQKARDNAVQQKTLDALMVDHKRQEQSLNEREARLKDAEQQHKYAMESGHNGLTERSKRIDEGLANDKAQLDSMRSELNAREKALDKRAKLIQEQEDSLVVARGQVDRREAYLKEQQAVYSEKQAKLKELIS